MKLNAEKNAVERSSNMEEQQFSMEASPAAFKILSDGLYSDKIKAVIRELCCNAADSHKAAKTSKPFELSLPAAFNPTFTVKDYGLGLSHEDVMHLYTTYFRSNKSDNNKVTGGFGLGSKSPFAYTDSFTIISNFNGKRGIYTAFISENGAPSITCLSRTETQEPNGVTVSLEVNPKDFNAFENKTHAVLEAFDNPPLVDGKCFNKKEKLTIIETNTWALIKKEYAYDQKHILRMGNVDYPLILNKNTDVYTPSLRSTFQAVTGGCPPVDIDAESALAQLCYSGNFSLLIKVPVGFVEPTPSRESLSYTDRARKSLEKIYRNIIENFSKEIQKDIDASPNKFSAIVKTVKNSLLSSSNLYNSLRFTYKGKDLDYGWPLFMDAQLFRFDCWGNQVSIGNPRDFRSMLRSDDVTIPIKSFNEENSKIKLVLSTQFKYTDRIKKYMRDNNLTTVLFFYAPSDTGLEEVLEWTGLAKADFVNVETLPKVKRSISQTKALPEHMVIAKKLDLKINTWEDTQIDLNKETGIYLWGTATYIRSGYDDHYRRPYSHIKFIIPRLFKLSKYVTSIPITDKTTFIAVSSKAQSKLDSHKNWHRLEDIIEEIKNNIFKNPLFALVANGKYRNFDDVNSFINILQKANNEIKTPDPLITSIIKDRERFTTDFSNANKAMKDTITTYEQLSDSFGRSVYLEREFTRYEKPKQLAADIYPSFPALKEKYSFIWAIVASGNYYSISREKDEILKYIEMVISLSKLTKKEKKES